MIDMPTNLFLSRQVALEARRQAAHCAAGVNVGSFGEQRNAQFSYAHSFLPLTIFSAPNFIPGPRVNCIFRLWRIIELTVSQGTVTCQRSRGDCPRRMDSDSNLR